jgi:4-aminobutyrate aminotransferase-like enzyme
LLVIDEIFTGFGRTGRWFACEHSGVVPDLICLGKAMTGGFPLSACVGKSELMDAAWPASTGEAIHTSTFLGHPVGCAMALAQIEEIRQGRLCERARRLGAVLREGLGTIELPEDLQGQVRGLGLMVGYELRYRDGRAAAGRVFEVAKQMLRAGFIVLPEGEAGDVIGFTPPLTITRAQIEQVVAALTRALR